MTSAASTSSNSPLARWRVAAVALSIAAALVAGYLGIMSMQARGTPWGCGAGSGCANVLQSRWSNVAGIPVGFFAVVMYLTMALLSWNAGPRHVRIVTALAAAVLSSAIYFGLLQVVIIQAICPWCMLDHTLGIAASLAAMVVARRQTVRSPTVNPVSGQRSDPFETEPAPPPMPGRRASAAGSVMAGVGLTMLFVGVQHFTARAPDVARIESTFEESGGALTLALREGTVSLQQAGLPAIGRPDAKQRLVLMFDYCCPHCREAHNTIRRLQLSAGDAWRVLFVPAPLNSECNPAVEETEDRFRDACRLAKLSLAVWRVKPADWPAFDAWLFEPETPRSAREAHDHASALYGELEIAEALAHASLDSTIAVGVHAFHASGGKVLPVILSPGSAGIAGRTDSEQELRELLAREFGFPQAPAPESTPR
ncbi:Vitamin K epoxide reductase family protein [Caulifigura coniformis]|uniref:Vitamin K epoxide reductase family protein n=1 Tax=Caulifigura coniformis TaxID=2527983 RepID=A0A517SG66_9PLAN|nr:vitamin K epoxide reductase family protein [Caulifigura coniformis]QDT55126.1 Vitamin K epoxide reductase family protein [Caulifigura coniformis]